MPASKRRKSSDPKGGEQKCCSSMKKRSSGTKNEAKKKPNGDRSRKGERSKCCGADDKSNRRRNSIRQKNKGKPKHSRKTKEDSRSAEEAKEKEKEKEKKKEKDADKKKEKDKDKDKDKEKKKSRRKKNGISRMHPPSPSPANEPPKPPPPQPQEKLRFDNDKKLAMGLKFTVKDMEVTVLKLLGSGGFGDVYLVEDQKQSRYAMKTEYDRVGSASRMKMEVKAYDKINKAKKANAGCGSRLLSFFGSGAVENLKFFLMSLVGPSVEDLIVKYEICYGTALRLSIECFDGIVDLHNCGFVHRDIKPENYSIGLNEERRKVYLVDLGMVVRVIDDKEKGPLTSKYDFIGTQLYAPRTSHLGNVQTRRDDLESWLYSCVDIFAPNKLPWSREHDRHKILELKEEFFRNPPKDALSQMPSQFEDILKKIDAIGIHEKPDYKALHELLEQAAKDEEIDFGEPFEWEMGEAKKNGVGGDKKKPEDEPDCENTQMSVLMQQPNNDAAAKAIAL